MRVQQEQLDFLKEQVLSRAGNARVYLFGSRTDDTQKGGDIDILILSEEKLSFIDKTRIKYAFYEKYGIRIDWPPHHTARWHRRTFEVMGERFGWEVVDHQLEPIGVFTFLKEFASHRVLNRSKNPGTLSHRIRLIRNRRIRYTAFAPLLILEILCGIPLIPRLWSGSIVGRVHWVEMLRNKPI